MLSQNENIEKLVEGMIKGLGTFFDVVERASEVLFTSVEAATEQFSEDVQESEAPEEIESLAPERRDLFKARRGWEDALVGVEAGVRKLGIAGSEIDKADRKLARSEDMLYMMDRGKAGKDIRSKHGRAMWEELRCIHLTQERLRKVHRSISTENKRLNGRKKELLCMLNPYAAVSAGSLKRVLAQIEKVRE